MLIFPHFINFVFLNRKRAQLRCCKLLLVDSATENLLSPIRLLSPGTARLFDEFRNPSDLSVIVLVLFRLSGTGVFCNLSTKSKLPRDSKMETPSRSTSMMPVDSMKLGGSPSD